MKMLYDITTGLLKQAWVAKKTLRGLDRTSEGKFELGESNDTNPEIHPVHPVGVRSFSDGRDLIPRSAVAVELDAPDRIDGRGARTIRRLRGWGDSGAIELE